MAIDHSFDESASSSLVFLFFELRLNHSIDIPVWHATTLSCAFDMGEIPCWNFGRRFGFFRPFGSFIQDWCSPPDGSILAHSCDLNPPLA